MNSNTFRQGVSFAVGPQACFLSVYIPQFLPPGPQPATFVNGHGIIQVKTDV